MRLSVIAEVHPAGDPGDTSRRLPGVDPEPVAVDDPDQRAWLRALGGPEHAADEGVVDAPLASRG